MSISIRENNKKYKPTTKSYGTTKEELLGFFGSRESRSFKGRIQKVTDKGPGHWYFLSYNNGSFRQVVVFMNDSRTKAMVSYRIGRKVEEVECEINQSISKGNAVWNVFTDREYVSLDENQLLNSFASADTSVEEKDQIIARQAEEIKALKDALNRAVEDKIVESSKRKRQFAISIKRHNKIKNLERLFKSQEIPTPAEIDKQLEDFSFEETEQEILTETEVEQETETLTPYQILENEIVELEEKRANAETPEEGATLSSIIKGKRIRLASTSNYIWSV